MASKHRKSTIAAFIVAVLAGIASPTTQTLATPAIQVPPPEDIENTASPMQIDCTLLNYRYNPQESGCHNRQPITDKNLPLVCQISGLQDIFKWKCPQGKNNHYPQRGSRHGR
jgi:hypothetical protein